jgi:hypothetical protein
MPSASAQAVYYAWAGGASGLTALRVFLLTRSLLISLALVVGVVALVRLVMVGLARYRRAVVARTTAGRAGVLASIACIASVTALDDDRPVPVARRGWFRRARSGHTWQPGVACVLVDGLLLLPRRGDRQTPIATVRRGEVSTANWAAAAPFGRVVAVLELTTAAGAQVGVMIDLGGGRRDFADFRAAVEGIWPGRVNGDPVAESVRGIGRRFRSALLGGALLGVLATPLITSATLGWGLVSVPGYRMSAGVDGRGLVPGRPWGHACAPIVIELDPAAPALIRDQVAEIESELRPSRLDLTFADQDRASRPSAFRGTAGSRRVVSVPVTLRPAGGLNPEGRPSRYQTFWSTRHDLDGRHDHLVYLSATLYTDALAGDPVMIRKALRAVAARAAGIEVDARTAGTGLAARLELSADRYTLTDLHALGVLSGCAAG